MRFIGFKSTEETKVEVARRIIADKKTADTNAKKKAKERYAIDPTEERYEEAARYYKNEKSAKKALDKAAESAKKRKSERLRESNKSFAEEYDYFFDE